MVGYVTVGTEPPCEGHRVPSLQVAGLCRRTPSPNEVHQLPQPGHGRGSDCLTGELLRLGPLLLGVHELGQRRVEDALNLLESRCDLRAASVRVGAASGVGTAGGMPSG